ncbi:hypothetical protein PHMEG_0005308 [Phytophthora megakarya]|uniref:Uncharacterized protein n=1 Tax=Phytophthora megakarya TaxID=4795 RepID=A0A225WRU0_9STRA|nr:hypothetical protein PHMEG_0005308 [Phytophthora megakarya]
MTVLPVRLLDTCGTHVVLFQIRWFSDHVKQMSEQGSSVVVDRTVYEVLTLQAMRSWHNTVAKKDDIDAAIKWVDDLDLNGRMSDESI